MRLLLDTVVLICAVESPERLTKRATAALEDLDNIFELSTISLSEIAIKAALGKQSEVTLEIEPRSSARLQTLGGEELQSGWMRLRSNTVIQGTSIFQFSGYGAENAQTVDPGGVDFEAGIATAESSDLLSLFVQKVGAFNTGVVIANPNSQAATILMTLKIEGIADAVTTNVEIPAFGQRARFVNEFFEGKVEGDFEGTLTLEGRIPIVATTIRTKNGFQMSSVPVGPARR